MPTISGLQLISDAMVLAGQLAPGETPDAGDSSYALGRLNAMLDSWNADRVKVFSVEFSDRTLIPNLNPHLIGSTGSTGFVVTTRPPKIESANLVLTTSTPNVLTPIELRDKAWYFGQTVPALTSDYPTDLYYDPAWPNGKLYFWPIPTVAYPVRLAIWTLLAQVTLAGNVTLPPAYQNALTYNLAVTLCIGQKSPDDVLLEEARKSLATIQGLNSESPRIGTSDMGSGRGGSYDWRTGQPW